MSILRERETKKNREKERDRKRKTVRNGKRAIETERERGKVKLWALLKLTPIPHFKPQSALIDNLITW